jgi:hypothetical protein
MLTIFSDIKTIIHKEFALAGEVLFSVSLIED